MRQLNIRIDDYTHECLELLLFYYEKEIGKSYSNKEIVQKLINELFEKILNEDHELVEELAVQLSLEKVLKYIELND